MNQIPGCISLVPGKNVATGCTHLRGKKFDQPSLFLRILLIHLMKRFCLDFSRPSAGLTNSNVTNKR